MNTRQRERIEVELNGSGVLLDTGEVFSFQAMDFTMMGMQMKVAGLRPLKGQKIALDFEVMDLSEEKSTINLSGKIVRLIKETGNETVCGVRWEEDEGAQNIEALENYYLEQYFDQMD